MHKVLLKKQFEELFSRIMSGSMGGIRHVKLRMMVFAALAVYVLGMMVFLFCQLGEALCAPLCAAGLSWMYFSLMGLVVLLIALVGSVFIAHSMLYQSRDNELLLSMPIPPGAILFSRMALIYLIAFLIEVIAWVPVCVQYFKVQMPTAGALAANLVLLFAMPLVVLVLSCILGWVIALISSRIQNGVAVTMVFTLIFIALYYYIYAKASEYLQLLLLHSSEVSARLKTVFYLIYQLGHGAVGEPGGLLFFTGVSLAAFGVTYAVLSASFIRLVTRKRGAAKQMYRERTLKQGSVSQALLAKEFRRFTASPVYMLNCGLGALLLVIGAGAAIVKRESLLSFLAFLPAELEKNAPLPLVICLAVAAVSSMNELTGASISMEGKNLWLVQSLPVTSWQVLQAKLTLHLLVSGIPSVLCAAVLNVLTGQTAAACILAPLCCLLFTAVCAAFGLLMNLGFPNFTWVNETVAVKQSMSVTLSMLVPWVVLAAYGFLYAACRQMVGGLEYLAGVTVTLGILTAVLLRVLQTKGVKLFEGL